MINVRTMLTAAEYQAQRYTTLVKVEESNDPKEDACLDSKQIPTIGIGFNLRVGTEHWIASNASTDGDRQNTNFYEIIREIGIDPFQAGLSASRKATELAYAAEIADTVRATWQQGRDATLRQDLDDIMDRRATAYGLSANHNERRFVFHDSNNGDIRRVLDNLVVAYETNLDGWLVHSRPNRGRTSPSY